MKEVNELKKLLLVCNIYQKILSNNLKKFLDTATKKIIAASIIICVLVFGVIGGYLLSNEVVSLFLSGDASSVYLLVISQSLTAFIMTVAFFAVFSFISSDSSTLEQVLSWMPIKNIYRKLGIILPQMLNIIMCVMILMIILYLPAMFVNQVSIGVILTVLASSFIQSVLSLLLIETFYHIFVFITYHLHIPYFLNISLSFSIILSSLYVFMQLKNYSEYLTDYQAYSYQPIYIGSGIYAMPFRKQLSVSINPLIYFLIVAGIIAAFLLAVSTDRSKCEQRPLKLLQNWRFTSNKAQTLLMKELKFNVRNEDNFLLILLILLAAILCRMKFGFNTENLTVVIVLAAVSTLPVFNSYSLDLKYIRLYKQLGVSPLLLYVTKLLGALIYSAFIYIILNMIYFSSFNGLKYSLLGVIFLLVFSVSFNFMGILIPKNPEVPTAQAAGIITVLLIILPLFYVFTRIIPLNHAGKIVLTACVFICSIIGGIWMNQKRWYKAE